MRQGNSPTEAASLALARIAKYYPKYSGGLVAVNKDGEFGKFSCRVLFLSSYYVQGSAYRVWNS